MKHVRGPVTALTTTGHDSKHTSPSMRKPALMLVTPSGVPLPRCQRAKRAAMPVTDTTELTLAAAWAPLGVLSVAGSWVVPPSTPCQELQHLTSAQQHSVCRRRAVATSAQGCATAQLKLRPYLSRAAQGIFDAAVPSCTHTQTACRECKILKLKPYSFSPGMKGHSIKPSYPPLVEAA